MNLHSRNFLCLVLLIVLSSLVLPSTQQDLCALPKNANNAWVGTVAQLKACYNSLPLAKKQATDAIRALRDLTEMYSFADIAKNSGAPYHVNVDLKASLTQFESKINSGGYTNDYSFQTDLLKTFNSLNDAHTLYMVPNGYRCFVIRPFGLKEQLLQNEVRFVIAEGSVDPAVTENLYRQLYGITPSNYWGMLASKINGLPTQDHLWRFAGSMVSLYKDQGVRYNAALRAFWSQIGLSRFSLNDPLVDTHTGFTMPNGTTISIPNLAFCPNAPTSTQNVIKQNSLFATLQDDSTASIDASSNSFIFETVKNAVMDTQTKKSISMGDFDVHKQLEDEISNAIQSLGPSYSVNHDVSAKLQNQQVREVYKRSTRHTSAVIQDLRRAKLMSKSNGEKDLFSTLGHNIPSKTVTPLVGNITIVHGSASPECVYMKYTEPSRGNEQVYVLKVGTFLPINHPIGYVECVQKFFDDASKDPNARTAIIDVQNNGGGVICYASYLASLLVPQWNMDPRQRRLPLGIYDYRQSVMTERIRTKASLLSEMMTNEMMYFEKSTSFFFENGKFFEPRRIERGGSVSNYTQQAYFPSACVTLNPGFKTHAFQNTLIVTDGTCGSACSLFLSQLASSKLATVISFGGLYNHHVPLSTSSFAGGNVLEYNTISATALIDNDPLLPAMLSSTASARFNFNEYYEIDDMEIPREYLKRPADFHLNYWAPIHNHNINTESGKNNLATLYELSYSAVFDQMPVPFPERK